MVIAAGASLFSLCEGKPHSRHLQEDSSVLLFLRSLCHFQALCCKPTVLVRPPILIDSIGRVRDQPAGWSRRSIRTRAAAPQIWHAVQVTGTRCSTDRQLAVTGCLDNLCSGSAWAAIGWCIKITFRDFSRTRFPVPKFYLVNACASDGTSPSA